jgi:hypothetical protein
MLEGSEGMVERKLRDSRSTEFREIGAVAFKLAPSPRARWLH